MGDLNIFLAGTPGLEQALLQEAQALGFKGSVVPGGVETTGDWPDIWRANLWLRGAARVLVRVAEFRAPHLAVLDKRARRVVWTDFLRLDVPVKAEVTCRKSKIYHAGAAAQRIENALKNSGFRKGDGVTLKVRIDEDLCTISLDTSGAPLHRRGHKEFIGKAPMRETLAALFLAECGYQPGEPVIDPMCGSGTFVIEAAEIAAGLAPGRSRNFGFEALLGFDKAQFEALKAPKTVHLGSSKPQFFGFDRDDGAIRGATENAQRAGIAEMCDFTRQAISDLKPPPGPPGLVIVNPPYGARIGNRKLLFALYDSFGKTLRQRFRRWRVGLVTSDAGLAKSCDLPFLPPSPPVALGPLKIRLWRTGSLP